MTTERETIDRVNVRAAIQAATMAGQYNLAKEIAEQNGLPDICLCCAATEATRTIAGFEERPDRERTIEDAAETYVLSLCDACTPKFPLMFAPALRKRLLRRRR